MLKRPCESLTVLVYLFIVMVPQDWCNLVNQNPKERGFIKVFPFNKLM